MLDRSRDVLESSSASKEIDVFVESKNEPSSTVELLPATTRSKRGEFCQLHSSLLPGANLLIENVETTRRNIGIRYDDRILLISGRF